MGETHPSCPRRRGESITTEDAVTSPFPAGRRRGYTVALPVANAVMAKDSCRLIENETNRLPDAIASTTPMIPSVASTEGTSKIQKVVASEEGMAGGDKVGNRSFDGIGGASKSDTSRTKAWRTNTVV